jgi:tRNA A37 threonylcarbamoyladenosine biosynthesis protein TsaE
VSHPDHIVVIEWAEKLKTMLPNHAIRIRFSHGRKSTERIITIAL